MSFDLMVFSGMAAITFAAVSSIIGVRKRGTDFKCLSFFLCVTLLTETLALYFDYHYHNNLAVYQLMGPVVMAGSSLYFNYSMPVLRKYHIGYIGAGLGFIFTIINLLFFEGLHKLNTNFAQLECLCNVCYSLFFFYRLMKSDRILHVLRNPYFWNALLFLVFYLCTFLSWGLIAFLDKAVNSTFHIVYIIIDLLNIIFYTCLGLVLILLKPTKQNCAQYRV